MTDLIIKGAGGIKDGLYVIKDGELFKYKPNRGTVYTVRSYHIMDRPKGEWIDEDGTYYANCSMCGYQMDTHQERGYFRYCPNCGAYMRGEDE